MFGIGIRVSVLAAGVILAGCGGSGSSDGTATSVITGTVPGTLIEAFCTDGSYYSTHSVDNGSAQHPFELEIPRGLECHLVMTTHENSADSRVVTPISLGGSGGYSTLFTASSPQIELGYVDLPIARSANDGSESDGVRDLPLPVTVAEGSVSLADAASDPMDSDHDGVINLYEDSDHDGIPNQYDEDDDNDGTPDMYDNDNNGDHLNDNDFDGDGITNDVDRDDDNDGISDASDPDDDNDGYSDEEDDDDDNDGIVDSNDPDQNNGGTGNSGGYTLLAWNDLGMHCVDGEDYSIFSILPPYNNLHAQLKKRDGGLVVSGVTLTYESLPSATGTWNTTSMLTDANEPKTNFWSYVDALFGTTLADDTGLTGVKMTSTTPEPMSFNATHQWWEAEGIPITPIDDNGAKNFYPRVKVIAKDGSGAVLAEAVTVLPVSDEMDCRACHGSTSASNDAQPSAGWVNVSDALKDYKLNILRLHDEKFPSAVADHQDDLAAKGYAYDPAGLEATQAAGTPILCASCHSSNALPGTGVTGVKPLTQALHGKHAAVKDPDTGVALNDTLNRTSCYRCHPGQATQCLRGAMGNAKNPDGTAQMDCQSCHGTMDTVASATRQGWLDQPNCQACHQNGQQHTNAIDPQTGTIRAALDGRFATQPNTPAPGYSLYRFSTGHGKLQCESCHGATHAIYPTHEAGDNLLSQNVQGHTGTIGECTACHATVPMTRDGGPHGMHTVGQSWVSKHGDYAESSRTSCAACHGSDYRGSVLSKMMTARTFTTEHSTKSFAKGQQIGCYECHNGPSGD